MSAGVFCVFRLICDGVANHKTTSYVGLRRKLYKKMTLLKYIVDKFVFLSGMINSIFSN